MKEYSSCIFTALMLVMWIVIGIVTFNKTKPDTFGTALLWILIWHIATAVFDVILWGLAVLLTNKR